MNTHHNTWAENIGNPHTKSIAEHKLSELNGRDHDCGSSWGQEIKTLRSVGNHVVVILGTLWNGLGVTFLERSVVILSSLREIVLIFQFVRTKSTTGNASWPPDLFSALQFARARECAFQFCFESDSSEKSKCVRSEPWSSFLTCGVNIVWETRCWW